VAYEFNAEFALIAETRGHIAEWIGQDAYCEWFRSMSQRRVFGEDVQS